MIIDGNLKDAFCRQKVLVIGDFMLDKYLGGDVNRISPEAPVPVLKKEWTKEVLGGAGNVVSNIHSLGGKTRAITVVGKDSTADKILELLNKLDCDTQFILTDPDWETIVKTRVVARNQQVIRIDEELIWPFNNSFLDHIKDNIDLIMNGITAVILSDYNKGVLSPEVCSYMINKCTELSIPISIDPKGSDWSKYKGATIITPNVKELSEAAGHSLNNNLESQLSEAGFQLADKYSITHLIVTRSENGISLVTDGSFFTFPVIKKQVIDVSGAGDTVISTIVMAYSSGLNLKDCCELANQAASIVVSRFGTSAVTIDELLFDYRNRRSKIISLKDISYIVNKLRDEGKKIIFTNGCFDLLHLGHIESLTKAKELGDTLIVGLNSDESVKRLKGETRPIFSEYVRSHMLESLTCVDYVIIFSDDTPESLIKLIKPDILVKGSDYKNKEVVGESFVKSYGGYVQFIELIEGLSTTKIIDKIKKL